MSMYYLGITSINEKTSAFYRDDKNNTYILHPYNRKKYIKLNFDVMKLHEILKNNCKVLIR